MAHYMHSLEKESIFHIKVCLQVLCIRFNLINGPCELECGQLFFFLSFFCKFVTFGTFNIESCAQKW